MQTLRFATYLAPNLYETYEYIARYVGEKVGHAAVLTVGHSFDEFAEGQVDVGFICGLPYVQMADSPSCSVELLVAPVLQGERYQQKPIYFSDVIVRKDSPYASCADVRGLQVLQGCIWAYNQRVSHSGWNIVCYSLREQGEPASYFGQMIESGSHQRSVLLVLEGRADATAVDSHVLDVFLAKNREAAAELRIIDMLGPSSIPPVVIAKTVDQTLKRRVQEVLLTMHEDPHAASALRAGAINRFVQVSDEGYQDIRKMRESVGGQGAQGRGRAQGNLPTRAGASPAPTC
jgi:phosphonate transport system substrate-binding protein